MNIAEIARQAGVSRAAVSRYFNQGYISEEKREAIRKVVEETGYRPSLQAQTLRTRKTKMIGVIVPQIAFNSIGKIVEGVLSVLNERGYQMVLAVTQNDPKKELEYLKAFDEKQVDGVLFSATILTGEHKNTLKNMNVPVVIMGQEMPGFPCVYHDDYHALYDLTRLFLERGRKKLGYISATHQDKAAGKARYQGFADCVRDWGAGELADNYVVADFSIESGRKKAEELLKKCPDLDGFLCATDEMAVGAIQYLREQGIGVPEQIQVSGHGDSALAGAASPPLTTVHYSYEKSGETAVNMLLEMLNQGDTLLREVKLGYSIVDKL